MFPPILHWYLHAFPLHLLYLSVYHILQVVLEEVVAARIPVAAFRIQTVVQAFLLAVQNRAAYLLAVAQIQVEYPPAASEADILDSEAMARIQQAADSPAGSPEDLRNRPDLVGVVAAVLAVVVAALLSGLKVVAHSDTLHSSVVVLSSAAPVDRNHPLKPDPLAPHLEVPVTVVA